MNENYFMGLDGFVWFTGVVESRDDPAKLGRVQVRCLGYHTEDLNDIPSPYLNGLLDPFLDQPYIPLLETNRSCPYRCTFCA